MIQIDLLLNLIRYSNSLDLSSSVHVHWYYIYKIPLSILITDITFSIDFLVPPMLSQALIWSLSDDHNREHS